MVCCHIGDEAFETAQFLLSKGARVNGYPQVTLNSSPLLFTYCSMELQSKLKSILIRIIALDPVLV